MNVRKIAGVGALWASLMLLMLAAGCATHKPSAPVTTTTETDGPRAMVGEPEPGGDKYALNGKFDPTRPFMADASLKTVYFDFDSSELRPDARAILEQNAARIQAGDPGMIQVAGHCDERGTQEYNLALGERRALAVREYLMRLGVSGDRVITISYGEEMPEAEGHDESAWSLNRRGMFNRQAAQ